MWCVPEIDEEYIDRMEDILRLYARSYDEHEPVVCLDERPVVLRADARPRQSGAPGRCTRVDYEYVRKGTANVFCIVEPLTGRRLTQATKNRTGRAFAAQLKRIARRYSRARRIHLVVDNLSTHTLKALVERYGESEGRALGRRFRIHYTPTHASWLNAAEIEASLVAREALGKRRFPSHRALRAHLALWRGRADRARRSIAWSFTVSDARKKFRYDRVITSRSKH
jgi:hypothetical protein